ncbi:MAG: exodeoxyribonuclease VII small subunit [Bacilli bacterium]
MGKTKFEEQIEKLKELIVKLESEEITLDEAVELYQKGIRISKDCKDKLNQANEVIKTVVDENGNEEEFSEEK